MAAVVCGKLCDFRPFYRSLSIDKAATFHRTLGKRELSSSVKKQGKSGKSKYKDTIHLPKTDFPLWLSPPLRPKHDAEIMQKCRFASLYEWQRKTLEGKEFVLHDGPPYANGAVHVGHAVNKVLKDIIMRSELLNGNIVHYIPGWDCHGLPIELKAISSTEKQHAIPSDIRKKARNFATKAIEEQRSAFQSWGVLGDWSENCYHTFDNKYIKNQLHSFLTLYEKGLIYRDLKPIFWSPSSRSALAEAELVYNKLHKSKSVFVRFQLVTFPFNVETDKSLYALVWTTTPWTLPANEAVMYKSNINYSVVEIENEDGCYIIADELVSSLAQSLKKDVKVLNTFLGKALRRATYIHPFHKQEVHKFLHADHITNDKGTGLVHCAPGHGREDYIVAVKNNLPIVSIADHEGHFSEATGPLLSGKDVLGNGTDSVLELLKSDLIHLEEFEHSYPYDWRTNKPVITLASQQWFFDCSSVKNSAMNEIKKVTFFPKKNSQHTMINLVNERPFWCISRQRVWGVPIPVLIKRECSSPIISRSLILHYCDLIDKYGSDFWWSVPIEELCPPHIATELSLDLVDLERSSDILDIWFDSGLSWQVALEGRTADLCLEGIDQFTGWFQSSLLTAVALQGKSPYKKLFSHGFVVDENGHKMSKSLGNVIDPQEIILGGKNADKQPAYGVDTLRWWVASHSVQHSSIPISISLIKSCSEALQKLRGTLKYSLGAIFDFPVSWLDRVPEEQLFYLDQFMLHSLNESQRKIEKMYGEHSYNSICQAIIEFVVNDVSAMYITLTKDRLYCNQADSIERRSCQFVIFHIVEFLLRSLAPIAPLLVEEAYLYHPHRADNMTYFEHQSLHPFIIDKKWHSSHVEDVLQTALEVKRVVNQEVQTGHSWAVDAIIHISKSNFNIVKPLIENQPPTQSQMAEILQVGSVELKTLPDGDSKCTVEVRKSTSALCGRCRRYRCEEGSDLCLRCDRLIQTSPGFSQQLSL